MSGFHDNALIGASGSQGYQISRSVRLRSSASAYFNRTLTTPTNNLKWTWSAWIKRGTLSVTNVPFGAGDGSSNNFGSVQFTTSDTIQFAQINGGVYNVQMVTSAVFRDPSAWYHLVIIYDSANATSTDRVQIYVNNVRQSVTYSTGPFAQNTASKINSAIAHYTGKLDYAGVYFDGYLTEINFIDGQALTPSSFGETNTTTGVWQPKKYAGTYGTNGFYLNFSDPSAATAAAIGKDNSGNGNNWTPNNISVTAGATYDSMLDVPTQWADGGNGRGNYATLNPLDKLLSPTVVDGNLGATVGDNAEVRGTIYVSSGKWYWEVVPTTMTFSMVGIGIGGATKHWATTGISYYGANGNKYVNGTASAYGASYTNNDVIGVALDLDNLQITFYKNNTSQGTITGLTAGSYALALSAAGNSSVYTANFGQRPFAYTPPSGFKALNTLNLPTPTILKGNQYFDATLYTGTDTTQSIINSGAMQPDLVWVKARNTAYNHYLYDVVRGATNALRSSTTGAESQAGDSTLVLQSNGFQVTGTGLGVNSNGTTIVGWQWKEGATQGFDIVTYTGTGSNTTIAHNLGVAPAMMILKRRSAIDSWPVYHASIGAANALILNNTNAQGAVATYWNNTAPTSSVFSVGTDSAVNASGSTYIAYLFSEVAGFSRFGSYTGNGSADGPFVFCGFRPRFVMVKNITSAADWFMTDTSRDTYNVTVNKLTANTATAEASNAGLGQFDILSNGFKQRQGTGTGLNNSGNTYIFMAMAENPFKNALAR